MIVNLTKVNKFRSTDFYCPIYEIPIYSATPQNIPEEIELTRVIYMF